ncbi:PREDICTED: 2-oxo-4-hydroxy-4-carboxy-5-ureidoimidazoline decarboxylase-like [Dufourea novaeangliae]|uniref:2-oxo-4-hydroxy-4-carboxy-5-ureidoimidazoline decarboxylase-like n=1 Tax=Dufourea novaeangliae TaxID=178035 RepID=UPI00076769A0|nr:PREDICTED: 2-oxo-4-hydroxy-4-carboxy-5-ureidoimidazoline decarboxylase-like [Dufourea novaeangliae]
MWPREILSISEVNALTPKQFEWLFGNIVEHYPDVTQYVASVRPFVLVKNLKKTFHDYLDTLHTVEKKNILLRYPDLAGRLAEGLTSTESEFGAANTKLEAMSKEEKKILSTYNGLYKAKFRFPFVICEHEIKIQTILTAMQMRLQNIRQNELQIAMEEVKKMCSNRIDDLCIQ